MTENECREKLAQWMLTNGLATGHGDTVDDLLLELAIQIDELQLWRQGLTEWLQETHGSAIWNDQTLWEAYKEQRNEAFMRFALFQD